MCHQISGKVLREWSVCNTEQFTLGAKIFLPNLSSSGWSVFERVDSPRIIAGRSTHGTGWYLIQLRTVCSSFFQFDIVPIQI
jgi:hypothetical protein